MIFLLFPCLSSLLYGSVKFTKLGLNSYKTQTRPPWTQFPSPIWDVGFQRVRGASLPTWLPYTENLRTDALQHYSAAVAKGVNQLDASDNIRSG